MLREATEKERILNKIKSGARLDLKEMNANNIAACWPQVKPRYLLNKNAGLNVDKTSRISMVRQTR